MQGRPFSGRFEQPSAAPLELAANSDSQPQPTTERLDDAGTRSASRNRALTIVLPSNKQELRVSVDSDDSEGSVAF